MHSIEIADKKQTLYYPENGYEFTKNQFLAFSGLVFQFMGGTISFTRLKVKLTYAFLNMARTANTDKDENIPVVENIMRISELNESFFNETRIKGKIHKQVDMVFFNQLLPVIKIGFKKYYGPSSALTNTVYGEYIQALTAFNDYSRTGEQHYLDTLIATLYRPKKWFNRIRKYLSNYSSDARRKFNPSLSPLYAKKIAKLPLSEKWAIYLFFASCQHFIATNEALDIGGGNTINLTLLFNQESTVESSKGIGIVGTLYSLAETRVFGNVKETSEQNTYDVLAFLVNQIEKINELKRNQKNVAS
ncbi:hypothetical protein [Abyssalbus ytuae]|uniref:Uncharacterized protein n=1 Tax=Abyssalbus ytuae TaxID=2926907 RepID=A0A9E6ZTT4_9FLAO|nr:hypothetical protein [Abyssalbus ytuae]UOB16576.1 hypothetical protein MQE35_12625 [Abyssalbus ytuae]